MQITVFIKIALSNEHLHFDVIVYTRSFSFVQVKMDNPNLKTKIKDVEIIIDFNIHIKKNRNHRSSSVRKIQTIWFKKFFSELFEVYSHDDTMNMNEYV